MAFIAIVIFSAIIGTFTAPNFRTDNAQMFDEVRIIVRKMDRTLELHSGGRLLKRFRISLGNTPVGDKGMEGDGKTPEGKFLVLVKNPKSRYTLSLGLNYPTVEHARRGLEMGLITRRQYTAIVKAARSRKMPPQKTALGGEIYIHGGGAATDWTLGCIALSDEDIRELYDVVQIGTEVEILP